MSLYNIVGSASLAAGQPEDVSQVVANLQAIQTILNGGIDDVNVRSTAAILLSKLNIPANINQVARGDGSWGALPIAALTGYPADIAQQVWGDGTWRKSGAALLWDTTDAAVTFPAASITSPSLSQGFKHLMVVWMARSNVAGLNAPHYVQPNSDVVAGNYNYEHLRANAATAVAAESLNVATGLYMGEMAGSTSEAGGEGVGVYFIFNYAAAVRKVTAGISGTVVQASSATSGFLEGRLHSGRHNLAAAITTLKFVPGSGSFNAAADSRISVYGLG
jgi:hypothetical protein